MSTENINPSNTPETDAMFTAWNLRKAEKQDIEGPGDFCRRKERECNRLRKCLEFIRDECNWETPRGDFGGGGDERIGPAINLALSNAE